MSFSPSSQFSFFLYMFLSRAALYIFLLYFSCVSDSVFFKKKKKILVLKFYLVKIGNEDNFSTGPCYLSNYFGLSICVFVFCSGVMAWVEGDLREQI